MKTIIVAMSLLFISCATYSDMQYKEMEEVEGNPFLEGLYIWWHLSN